MENGWHQLVPGTPNIMPTYRWSQHLTECTERKKMKVKEFERLKSEEKKGENVQRKLFRNKVWNVTILRDENKGAPTEVKAEQLSGWGHSRESVLSCWPVTPAKKINSLSLFVCVFLCQRPSPWHLNTEGELRVLARRESCIVPEKKGLQWLVDLEKTLQPLLASSLLIWKFSFLVPSPWYYRISYLSTRKVVSVENLTGLFPSTWVTLVTCMLQ